MLMDRIMGALMFKRETYAEVEHDASFTQMAWVLAAASAAIGALGSFSQYGGISGTVFAVIVAGLLGAAGLGVSSWVISFVGKQMFQADVTFEETVRVLGLASVWQVLNIFNIIPLLGGIVVFAAWIASLVAFYIAVDEALDLDTTQTIITVVIGWVAFAVIGALAGIFFGLGAAFLGLLGS